MEGVIRDWCNLWGFPQGMVVFCGDCVFWVWGGAGVFWF
ncbi:hypothetical protein A11S_687 [Micavibrio aeruginosavorus EPB]|uniref:Uncharacterized protein n=1 Tax=Micavibrio aeruginosavorus EPB TaxID=349215 RepID=M4VHK6_9BACT|nr:hypothetical protein A11S_687 [Micavibrio aeruginosavorus EPB]